MPEGLQIHQSLMCYALLVIGALLLSYIYNNLRTQSKRLRISRITIRKCPSCHLVFADSRFSKRRRTLCPRCHKEAKEIPLKDDAWQ